MQFIGERWQLGRLGSELRDGDIFCSGMLKTGKLGRLERRRSVKLGTMGYSLLCGAKERWGKSRRGEGSKL